MTSMSNSTIVKIIEKYSVGPLKAAEANILDKWLQGITPQEFHRTLDQCETLPAGLKEAHPVSARTGDQDRLACRGQEPGRPVENGPSRPDPRGSQQGHRNRLVRRGGETASA